MESFSQNNDKHKCLLFSYRVADKSGNLVLEMLGGESRELLKIGASYDFFLVRVCAAQNAEGITAQSTFYTEIRESPVVLQDCIETIQEGHLFKKTAKVDSVTDLKIVAKCNKAGCHKIAANPFPDTPGASKKVHCECGNVYNIRPEQIGIRIQLQLRDAESDEKLPGIFKASGKKAEIFTGMSAAEIGKNSDFLDTAYDNALDDKKVFCIKFDKYNSIIEVRRN